MKLEQVRKMALSLPLSTEEPHFQYTSFRVKGKIFATAPPDEEHLHVFVNDALREQVVGARPEVFEALHWGSRIVGVRVKLRAALPAEVAKLLSSAWSDRAPRAVAAAHRSSGGAPLRAEPGPVNKPSRRKSPPAAGRAGPSAVARRRRKG